MSKEKHEAWREMLKRADESRDDIFESWIVDSEEGASLEDQARHTNWEDDCENCES
tara:strand:+ start:140 stop:307 length:168 start_codon:yes stop_codon:yes gene_type:complete